LRFIISLTKAHTHLDGITVIAGGVINILRLYTTKTFIVVKPSIASGFGGGDCTAYERGFTASGNIKATIACEDA
jgi:hypothetical protein